MQGSVGVWEVLASFSLVALVVAISIWRRLGVERSVLWAAVRATVQLLAVGFFFSAIFESSGAEVWAWLWVVGMVVVSAWVVQRRTPTVPGIFGIGLAAITATVAVALAVVFGLRILETQPVAVVVIAGIVIGNTMPSVVQGADRMMASLREDRGQVEAMLALGFDGPEAMRALVAEVVRTALIPQIQRTKVVGLIALPGAMTGLLLAGTDPVDAVIIQLVVMFLVLGAVAISVVVVALAISRQALTPDLRLAPWTRNVGAQR